MSTTTAVVAVTPTIPTEHTVNGNPEQQPPPPPPPLPKLQALNPFWKAIGYPGTVAHYLGCMCDVQAIVLAKKKQTQLVLPPHPPGLNCNTTRPDDDDPNKDSVTLEQEEGGKQHVQLEYDVVIVGSGASGSVAASVLSQAGYQVLIVDQGPRPQYLQGSATTEQENNQYWQSGKRMTGSGNGRSESSLQSTPPS
ncbi:hypothetical protein ACA910_009689 [Epithemia clementina (nom. ined.)]